MGHKIYKNGYKDGSGKGTITFNEDAVLRTHWGCSCCDNGPTKEDISKADLIIKKLNMRDELLDACKSQHNVIDTLFAMLIDAKPGFYPSKTGWIWEESVKAHEVIQKTEQ